MHFEHTEVSYIIQYITFKQQFIHVMFNHIRNRMNLIRLLASYFKTKGVNSITVLAARSGTICIKKKEKKTKERARSRGYKLGVCVCV